MGFVEKTEKEKMSMEEAAGVEFVESEAGGRWRIRVYTLGAMWKFNALMAAAATTGDERAWMRFLQASLMSASPAPGWCVRARRVLGLPDFTLRRIGAAIRARELPAVRDAVLRANIGIDYADFVRRCEDAVKKKTNRNSGPDMTERDISSSIAETPDGPIRSARCSSIADCAPGTSSQ